RHTRFSRDWSSDVCSSDLLAGVIVAGNDVPTAGLEKLRNQPFPVPSAPEFLRLSEGGPHPHSRTTKPNFLNSWAKISARGPIYRTACPCSGAPPWPSGDQKRMRPFGKQMAAATVANS